MHNDYPLAPEKLAVSRDMLSKYYKEIADKYGIKVGDIYTKYVLHYRNIQLYLSLGMKLTKTHKVLKFKQSNWMNKYIDFDTKKRKNATNDFEKDFFKIDDQFCLWGKTMENLRKRIKVRIMNNEEDFLKYTRRPTHITHKIFAQNCAAIYEIKQVLMLNKPIYVDVYCFRIKQMADV